MKITEEIREYAEKGMSKYLKNSKNPAARSTSKPEKA